MTGLFAFSLAAVILLESVVRSWFIFVSAALALAAPRSNFGSHVPPFRFSILKIREIDSKMGRKEEDDLFGNFLKKMQGEDAYASKTEGSRRKFRDI